MENLPLNRTATLVPAIAVKDLSLDKTLMMIIVVPEKSALHEHYFNIGRKGCIILVPLERALTTSYYVK